MDLSGSKLQYLCISVKLGTSGEVIQCVEGGKPVTGGRTEDIFFPRAVPRDVEYGECRPEEAGGFEERGRV